MCISEPQGWAITTSQRDTLDELNSACGSPVGGAAAWAYLLDRLKRKDARRGTMPIIGCEGFNTAMLRQPDTKITDTRFNTELKVWLVGAYAKVWCPGADHDTLLLRP